MSQVSRTFFSIVKIVLFVSFHKIAKHFQKIQIFGRFSDFWKNFRFSDFWETTTPTKTTLGLVTFETMITILTVENLNSWQSLLPDNQCDTGQHSQFLRCFHTNLSGVHPQLSTLHIWKIVVILKSVPSSYQVGEVAVATRWLCALSTFKPHLISWVFKGFIHDLFYRLNLIYMR